MKRPFPRNWSGDFNNFYGFPLTFQSSPDWWEGAQRTPEGSLMSLRKGEAQSPVKTARHWLSTSRFDIQMRCRFDTVGCSLTPPQRSLETLTDTLDAAGEWQKVASLKNNFKRNTITTHSTLWRRTVTFYLFFVLFFFHGPSDGEVSGYIPLNFPQTQQSSDARESPCVSYKFSLVSSAGRGRRVAAGRSSCRCSNVRLVCICVAHKAALPPPPLPSSSPPLLLLSCAGEHRLLLRV